MYYVNNVT